MKTRLHARYGGSGISVEVSGRELQELMNACEWASQGEHHSHCKFRTGKSTNCDCYVGACQAAISEIRKKIRGSPRRGSRYITRRNPGDEFADYDASDREILNDVQSAFREFEESLSPKHTLRSELDRGFTVTHGYVPAWRSLLSPELDRMTSGLSSKVLEEGILHELFEETCNRLGDRGIVIWEDEADGTVLWAGTEKAYEKYSGEG